MGSLTRTQTYLWYANRMMPGADQQMPFEPVHSSCAVRTFHRPGTPCHQLVLEEQLVAAQDIAPGLETGPCRGTARQLPEPLRFGSTFHEETRDRRTGRRPRRPHEAHAEGGVYGAAARFSLCRRRRPTHAIAGRSTPSRAGDSLHRHPAPHGSTPRAVWIVARLDDDRRPVRAQYLSSPRRGASSRPSGIPRSPRWRLPLSSTTVVRSRVGRQTIGSFGSTCAWRLHSSRSCRRSGWGGSC